MTDRSMTTVPFLFALALALAASPADAQGRRAAEKQNGKDRQEEVRRENDEQRPVLQRREANEVPRGWCQGRGNPHNTVENCGYQSTNSRIGSRGGSYEESHADFHRRLDDRYRTLAAQRPLDIRRQLELRAQKSSEHERWHAQTGTRHE